MPPFRWKLFRRYSFLVLVMGVGGCNSNPPTAPVEGKVLFDGEPLQFGRVMFQNTAGGPPAIGEISSDGTFKMSTFADGDGATLGDHRVRITCYTMQDPSKASESGPMGDSLGALLIPKKYTSLGASGLTATVVESDNPPLLFELSSKQSRRR